jgi:hypothetical protein
MDLGGLGVWSGELRYGDPAEAADRAAALEGLGYTALWIPDVGGPLFDAFDNLLGAWWSPRGCATSGTTRPPRSGRGGGDCRPTGATG